MKKFSLLLVVLLTTTLGTAQITFPERGISDKDNQYYLFKGGIIHSEPGNSFEGDILVHKGKIVKTGSISQTELPVNTVVHEIQGKHVFPSFLELNSGYGMGKPKKREYTEGPDYERTKNTSTYWNEAFHPEVSAAETFTPDKKEAERLQKMGFGVILTHQRDGIGRGSSALVTLNSGTANESMLLTTAGRHFSFSKGSSSQDYPNSLMGCMALMRQALYDAKWYETAKTEERNISLEAFNAQQELPLFFETREANDLFRFARIAQEFGLEGVVVGSGDSYQVIEKLDPEIKGIVAPLKFPKPFDMGDPELSRYVSQTDLMHWEGAPFNPAIISQSEIELYLSANGIQKNTEFFDFLLTAVKKGLDPAAAQAALTTSPADLLGLDDIGKIAPAYLANFFIADKDVFQKKNPKIIAHMVRGELNRFEEISPIEFAGKYDLNLNDRYLELTLSGEGKLKAGIQEITDSDTLNYKGKFAHQGNEVVLSFADSSNTGQYRLSAMVLADNRIWDGLGIDPAGNEIKWTAIKQKEKKRSSTPLDTLETDSVPAPPKMLFPLTAYGLDSLPEAKAVLITNATVWTLEEKGIIEGGSVLIANGKIKSVGRSIDPVSLGITDYETYDGTGLHITPGIIDEHSHIAITRGVNEGTQSSTAEVRIGDAVAPSDINIYRQLAGGVTTAQLLHGSANPIGGQSAIVKLRWGETMDNMIFKEAPGFMKFALGENVKQSNWGDDYNIRYPQTRMGVEQFMYDSFYRAKSYGQLKRLHEAGNEKKKKRRSRKSDTPSEPFRTDLELEALLEVLNGERFITCHSYVQSEINMLMHLADSMGFTLNTFTHILEGYKVADKMKAHGATASTFSDWWAYKYEVKDAIPHNASLLNRMGVVTGINSDDAEMGRRLNQEAAKGIRYGGMSEEDALKLVTLNPAKILHVDEYVGSLKEGKHADVVIWTDHPLSVYAKVLRTYVDGKLYFDREEMEENRQRDLAERNRIAEAMMNEGKSGTQLRKPKRKMERYYHCDTKE